jgi:predicted RNA-binding protein with PUA-like domain
MAYWLVKSEPGTWSWEDQKRAMHEPWNGVRNYQATNNMKAMKVGDLAYFYHSGMERQIVGIVKIVREYYPDPTDTTGRFGMVDVECVESLKHPVSLAVVKEDPSLVHLALVRQSRLSVMPIDERAWQIIYTLGQNL